MVAGANLIVGTVSIRQKRVKSASCSIPSQFMGSDKLNDCIADYDPSVEVISVVSGEANLIVTSDCICRIPHYMVHFIRSQNGPVHFHTIQAGRHLLVDYAITGRTSI